MTRILLITFACLIAIPFLLVTGYFSYSYTVDAYAQQILKKAAPDAVKFDYQTYETSNGAYDVHFYKFTEYNAEYTKDWETETTTDYDFKVRHVHSGPFTTVIIINPTAQRATIEYHCSFLE
jgi:ABC-type sulfate transport system substrate-binding protein